MTLAPEAFLARELEMCYHPICCVTHYAEGVKQRTIAPGELLEGAVEQAERDATAEAIARWFELAGTLFRTLPDDHQCPCGLTMESDRRECRIGEDWHAWIGKP